MNPHIYNLIVGFVPEGDLMKVAKEIETVVNEREKLFISAYGNGDYDLAQFTNGAVAMYKHLMEKNK